jgi:putative hydroxymethylpyrimidine transport system ATP-binding protein
MPAGDDRTNAEAFSISLSDITVGYGGAPVLAGFNAEFSPATVTCILGPSGCGKTTILKLLAGLMSPNAGSVRVSPLARIAWMAQRPALAPWLSVLGNVTLGPRLRGEPLPLARARSLVDAVGLAEVAEARPITLSGGMRQRAALAQVLMEDAKLVLMDEPFSSLDAVTKAAMYRLCVRLLAGKAVILVTHDPYEALSLAGRVLVLGGRPATIALDLALPTPAPRDPRHPTLDRAFRAISAALGLPQQAAMA